MDPVCCRVKDARRSNTNATGDPTVLMLCPLTKVICLLKAGTATLIMQTGKGTILGLRDLIHQVGIPSRIEAELQSGGVATFLKAERGCQIRADELKAQEPPVILQVCVLR